MTVAPKVLVVGAGPTGLTLALQAHLHGADVRIIERRPAAFRPSRALIVHPRTLEVLRPLGVTDALLARADTSPEVNLHAGSRVVRVRVGALPLPDTAFPHLSLLRQSDVETVLGWALAARGISLETGTELVGLTGIKDNAEAVQATMVSANGCERSEFSFVVGCDGADSTVRRLSGIGWHGGRYRHEVVLADVDLDPTPAGDAAHVALGRHGLLFTFPCGDFAAWRMLATRLSAGGACPHGAFGAPVPREELQQLCDDAGVDAWISAVAWSARVGLQHRLATRYRRGPIFLAGDAAHAHSPAAAQGMNGGIQDASNLGWKLAFASAAESSEALLDSYQAERRSVARRVVALTGLAFWGEASTDPAAQLLRAKLAPPLLPVLAPLLRMPVPPVTTALRILTQLQVHYRHSPLSAEGTPRLPGRPRAGDRMPNLASASVTDAPLHELLAQPGVHLVLQRDSREPALRDSSTRLRLHRLDGAGRGVIAVRPDGYVGFRCAVVDDQLSQWLDDIGAR